MSDSDNSENIIIEVSEINEEKNIENAIDMIDDENLDEATGNYELHKKNKDSIEDIRDKVFTKLGLNVLNTKLKKKVKIEIKERLHRVLSFNDLSPLHRGYSTCNSLEDLCGLHRRFDKVSYLEVRDRINDLYFDSSEYYSSSMDILATYVRGQKILYMESKYYSNVRLNYLMLPAIFLSSLATVFSLAFESGSKVGK